MTRIFLNGCCGRMGRAITDLASESDEFEIVAGADVVSSDSLGYPVYQSLAECKEEFDVVIDFSNAKVVPALIKTAVDMNKPVVCCTTGLDQETTDLLTEASSKIPVFKSANMSLGINILIGLAKKAAKVLYPGFDIEIVEAHHRRKLDAPSGTALMIADAINGECNNELEYVYDRHSRMQARDSKELGISAIRGGNIVGEHEVYFISDEETVKISHSAKTRDAFARGALSAARYINNKEPGFYSMDDMLSGAFEEEENA